jgi:5-methylcytosine-specific restriction endonuclease McrA|tara:strand:- start:44 stop:586 length:543 start_codon:yes stop_codon:yes gene_type:complete
LNNSVLLLNADGQPLSIVPLSTVSWQNAVKAMFAEKVHVIKNYENVLIRSTSLSIPCPSIIMLNKYHRQPTKAKYTRRNLYIRDNHCCQYCGEQFDYQQLTIDHVVPRSKGGRLTWENSVAACSPCNVKKADSIKLPMRDPVRPTWHKINYANKQHKLTIPDITWQNYVKWPEDKLILQS